jgi:polyhydroxybutyrate depolymerase
VTRRTHAGTVAVLVISGLVATSAVGATHTAGSAVLHVTVDGEQRTYRLHSQSDAADSVPLVVVLHGAGATAKEVERRYHWDPLADREGFVVAYPQGIGRRWDDSGTRDVKFLRALVVEVSRRSSIDPARVFVTGISNGGVMTYRAGCGLADIVAAIGPVAAWFPDCIPTAPVSVVHIHGLDDHVFGFAGGKGTPPVLEGLAAWRRADGCSDGSTSVRAGEVVHTAWRSCAPGVAVDLYTIARGQHEWPGAVPKAGNDAVSRALDATSTIWAFFEAHPRPD